MNILTQPKIKNNTKTPTKLTNVNSGTTPPPPPHMLIGLFTRLMGTKSTRDNLFYSGIKRVRFEGYGRTKHSMPWIKLTFSLDEYGEVIYCVHIQKDRNITISNRVNGLNVTRPYKKKPMTYEHAAGWLMDHDMTQQMNAMTNIHKACINVVNDLLTKSSPDKTTIQWIMALTKEESFNKLWEVK